MQIYTVRGGTIDELKKKNYTLGIGISLGNKWFTPENTLSLIKLGLNYSKGKVIVYVADSIHAINIEVRNKISYEKALKKANILGDIALENIKNIASKELSENEQKMIIYVKWSEISDNTYKNMTSYLYKLYETNPEFKKSIDSIVISFTEKESRQFTPQEITRLGNYIIEELPECLCRVSMKNTICDAYIYPYDGPLTIFIEKLQKGDIFPEIKENLLSTEPKVLIVAR